MIRNSVISKDAHINAAIIINSNVAGACFIGDGALVEDSFVAPGAYITGDARITSPHHIGVLTGRPLMLTMHRSTPGEPLNVERPWRINFGYFTRGMPTMTVSIAADGIDDTIEEAKIRLLDHIRGQMFDGDTDGALEDLAMRALERFRETLSD